jgi:hypothetical protein
MCKIYRLRPATEITLDELKNSYLWFSRPTEFNDSEDANIIAFADANENLKQTFDRIFSSYILLGKELEFIGICCFTESLPPLEQWRNFPKGNKGIFIEYDKDKLEKYFLDEFFMGDCFKKVEYLNDQLTLISSTEEGYDVLWEVFDNGCYYKSLRGDFERDEKMMDKLIFKLLTTINIRFQKQKEFRIILSGFRIPSKDPTLKGYKIPIPPNVIEYVYIRSETDNNFIEELKKHISPDQIKILN